MSPRQKKPLESPLEHPSQFVEPELRPSGTEPPSPGRIRWAIVACIIGVAAIVLGGTGTLAPLLLVFGGILVIISLILFRAFRVPADSPAREDGDIRKLYGRSKA